MEPALLVIVVEVGVKTGLLVCELEAGAERCPLVLVLELEMGVPETGASSFYILLSANECPTLM